MSKDSRCWIYNQVNRYLFKKQKASIGIITQIMFFVIVIFIIYKNLKVINGMMFF